MQATAPQDPTKRPFGATLPFMGLEFTAAAAADWRAHLLGQGRGGFAYVVTPNVDHVVQLNKRPELRPIYTGADWLLCDSRILNRLARMSDLDLRPYPGSDLTRDLLDDAAARGKEIAVIGPDDAAFADLAALYPDLALTHIAAPMMTRDSAAWQATLEAAEAAVYDILLICISFPKQEYFAADLKSRGRARGVALCVGASVDFLTGRQNRAPQFMRDNGLEWLHRLGSNPRRMFRRYVIDGPRIFRLYLKQKP